MKTFLWRHQPRSLSILHFPTVFFSSSFLSLSSSISSSFDLLLHLLCLSPPPSPLLQNSFSIFSLSSHVSLSPTYFYSCWDIISRNMSHELFPFPCRWHSTCCIICVRASTNNGRVTYKFKLLKIISFSWLELLSSTLTDYVSILFTILSWAQSLFKYFSS